MVTICVTQKQSVVHAFFAKAALSNKDNFLRKCGMSIPTWFDTSLLFMKSYSYKFLRENKMLLLPFWEVERWQILLEDFYVQVFKGTPDAGIQPFSWFGIEGTAFGRIFPGKSINYKSIYLLHDNEVNMWKTECFLGLNVVSTYCYVVK